MKCCNKDVHTCIKPLLVVLLQKYFSRKITQIYVRIVFDRNKEKYNILFFYIKFSVMALMVNLFFYATLIMCRITDASF